MKLFHRNTDSGQSLIELTICLPLVFLIISGLADLGYMLSSVEIISDAVRYGGSYAYSRSNPNIACLQLESDTRDKIISAYLTPGSTVLDEQQLSYWGEPVVEVGSKTWDELELPYVKVSIQANSNPNCIFCLSNLLKHIDYKVEAAYIPLQACHLSVEGENEG